LPEPSATPVLPTVALNPGIWDVVAAVKALESEIWNSYVRVPFG
jgi:hypothetical protein